MTDRPVEDQRADFEAIRRVIANDIKFKARLSIGEEAFTSLKLGNVFSDIYSLGGTAATGAGVAQSGLIASTFFAKTGFLSALGFGGAAFTPIGWVAAAAVASGGVGYGVTRLFRVYSQSRIETVPKFLTTPLDLLGASILDLMAALSLKIAAIDGVVDSREHQAIRDYFVEDWGYDADYVDHALIVLTANEDKTRLTEMTRALAEFVHSNPDCKFSVLQKEIKQLLTEVAEADGRLDEREEMAIERISRSLDEQNSITASLSRAAKDAGAAVSSATGWIGNRFKRTGKME